MASDRSVLRSTMWRVPMIALLVTAMFDSSAATAGTVDGEVVDGGDAIMVDAAGQPLASGNSDVKFSFRLPPTAECPGDSANDEWRWQGFIVPSDTDIEDIVWGVLGPEGDNHAALYDTFSRYLSHQNLLPNQAAGEPGKLPSLPFMTFSNFPKGYLDDGTYRIGIACTLQRDPSIFWDAEFIISSSDDGGSAGFTWTTPTAPSGAISAEPAESPRNWRPIAATGIAAGSLAGAFLLWRSARRTSLRKERP